MKFHTLVSFLGSALALPAAITPGDTDLGAIWFVGDSITQSNADGDPDGSPRKSLYDLLDAAGYSFTYTGHHDVNFDGLPATGTTPETNLYDYHSGVSGSVIGNDVSGRHGMTQNLPSHWTSGRLAVVKPNVVLIMLGTNDVNADIDRANAPARLTAYLDAIYSQPGIGTPTVLVASIPPNRTSTASPDKRVWVADFNAAVPGVVGAQRALGRDVHFVDQFTPLEAGYATLMAGDNLHTNAAGNDSLAQQWFGKIEEIVDGTVATGTGGLVATGDAASADTDNSSEAGRATVRAFVADIAGDDLIQAGSASLVDAVMDKAPSTVVGPGTSALNDGLGYPATGGGTGAFLPEAFGSGNKLPFTYTATLDTSANTAGYDISLIRTFAGWSQNGSALANQKYEVLVSYVGDTGFDSLGTYTFAPFDDANTTEAGATRLILSHPSGVISSGVDQVRLVFLNHGFDNHANTVDGSLYHEVDVIGAPTPLPVDYGIDVSGEVSSAETDNSGAAGYPAASASSAEIAA
ncbi:GDSL-type esterase/lipase family protein, partial [Luteolibacter marinus]|uniref:GDSL-type esterase/lipase family protein n=1 Tax=Luteolibacter marinus TaxID=2776705 RepID=UPI001D028014